MIWRNWRARCRKIFDEANLTELKIIGSGGLDEYDLAEFSAANVPFDSYGVGTKMGTSADAPWTDMSYKLVEYQNRPVLKLSTGKVSLPGRKQLFRLRDSTGVFTRDVIGLRAEQLGGERLLKEVMRGGKKTEPAPVFEREPGALRRRLRRVAAGGQIDSKAASVSS